MPAQVRLARALSWVPPQPGGHQPSENESWSVSEDDVEDNQDGQGFQGECKICGWVGTLHESHAAAEEETAEHAGYCVAGRERDKLQ